MVDSFEERQKAFEKQYEHEQDLLFRILSRRAKLVGLWAAEHMGLSGADAEQYAADMVQVDLGEPGTQDMLRRVRADFDARSITLSDHRIQREMERLLETARHQVMNE